MKSNQKATLNFGKSKGYKNEADADDDDYASDSPSEDQLVRNENLN